MAIENMLRKMEFISKKLAYLGAIALLSMMFLTTADVVGRYFFNKPVLGAFELTEFLVLILIFSFLAHSQAKKSHVAVDLIFDHLPAKIRTAVNFLNHLVCFGFMILIAYRGIIRALEIMEYHEATTNLGIVKYPFAFFVVLGCAALSLEYLRDLIAMFVKQKGED